MTTTKIEYITATDLTRSFQDVTEKCSNLIKTADLRYITINGTKKEEVILKILKKIDEDSYIIGSNQLWNKEWDEIYKDFTNDNYNLEKLVPKFITNSQSAHQPLRYDNKLIIPVSNTFWIDYYSIFRQWLFKTFLSGINYVYEFGCGTGYNLVALSQLYPDKKLYGLDFCNNSIKILNAINEHYNYDIKGYLFDMLNPDLKLELEENSAVLTMNSIEQLGGKFHNFIQYLIKQKPSLCINVEPTFEFHDIDNLLDWLSIKFMNKRKYSLFPLSYLSLLEHENKVKIIEAKRIPFGNMMSNCYTYIVWRPV